MNKTLSWFKIMTIVVNLADELNSVSRTENMTINEVLNAVSYYLNILGIDMNSTNQENINKLLKNKVDEYLSKIMREEFKNLVKSMGNK
jgi:NTP pyrophosphatase (non-canonical NTP hydrolase)